MSVKEVCELSSLLSVDDSERVTFERNLMELELAIDQEEQRVITHFTILTASNHNTYLYIKFIYLVSERK